MLRKKIIYLFLILLVTIFNMPLKAQETEKNILEQNFDNEEESEEKSDVIKTEDSNESQSGNPAEEIQDKRDPDGRSEITEEVNDSESEPAKESEEEKKDNTSKIPLLKGSVSKVPGGTKLKIILETPVDEITSMIDDEITARTSENIEIDGKVIIPAGSTVIGKISEINLAKRLHKAGSVRIEFKNLTMPDGRQVPIIASVLTHSGLIKGKYTKKSALISSATILGPAAAGFGAGFAAQGDLVGAGVGALIGTLAGVGLFTFQKGNMVDLKSGDELSIELTEEALIPTEDITGESEDTEKSFCNLEK